MPDDLTLLAAVLRQVTAGERLVTGRAFFAAADYNFHLREENGGRTVPGRPYAMGMLINSWIDRNGIAVSASDRGMSAHNEPDFLSAMAIAALAGSQHMLMPDKRFEEMLGLGEAGVQCSAELAAIRDKMEELTARRPRADETTIEP
jgi:hypothetical protein